MSASSRAAFLYNDKTAASRYLQYFEINPNVIAVAFVLESNQLFAQYQLDPDNPFQFPTISSTPYFGIEESLMHLIEPVYEGNQFLGYIYVVRDLRDVTEEIFNTVIFMSFVFAVSTLTALMFGIRIQRIITIPFANLLDTTQKIRTNQDYSVRAAKSTNDELGEVADSFNQMLNEIEVREQSLRVSEEWFRGIIENPSEFICVLDHDGRCTYLNPGMEKTIGKAARPRPCRNSCRICSISRESDEL